MTHCIAVPAGQNKTCKPVIRRLIRARGNRNFHARPIIWSILTLGTVVRIQTMKKNTATTLIKNHSQGGRKGPFQPARKKVVTSEDNTNASAYSTR